MFIVLASTPYPGCKLYLADTVQNSTDCDTQFANCEFRNEFPELTRETAKAMRFEESRKAAKIAAVMPWQSVVGLAIVINDDDATWDKSLTAQIEILQARLRVTKRNAAATIAKAEKEILDLMDLDLRECLKNG